MIIWDMEVFKYDWLICWLDTETRKVHSIVNDKVKFEKFYEYYKDRVWVGYNSRNYDQWIAKALLCDFSPYAMNNWIIKDDKKGHEFSALLYKFPILNYDCSGSQITLNRSLKELEGFMGHEIKESSVPFDIDRKLTPKEIEEVVMYCKHDVMETFEVFMQTIEDYESHIGLLQEFKLDISYISKTKAQLSAVILGANRKQFDDEFDISIPNTLQLGHYEYLRYWYMEWATEVKDYDKMSLKTDIAGVPHIFAIGGLHGSIDNHIGEGLYLMADVASYYPALMIEYAFLSRTISNPTKFRQIRDERLRMKAIRDKRQNPRKIVLNGTYGASKDKYNQLYDPLQANNVCIGGQLLLTDLVEKVENDCQLIQTNTDGIMVKVHTREDIEKIKSICKGWETRTKMDLEFDVYTKVFQKDVNNYIIIPDGELYDSKGKERFKRKGAWAKQLSPLDNNLPIVNKALVDYFVHGTKPEVTIGNAKDLIDFQIITKVGRKYEYAYHNNRILKERVNRCFASNNKLDSTLYKKKPSKVKLDKVANAPDFMFIDNSNILGKSIPKQLDKQWYIDLTYSRIKAFMGA